MNAKSYRTKHHWEIKLKGQLQQYHIEAEEVQFCQITKDAKNPGKKEICTY
jgi:hypothetical protein